MMKTLGLYWRQVVLAIAIAFTGAGFGTTLSGCETTEGAGRDIQAAGEGIEGAADDTRPYDE